MSSKKTNKKENPLINIGLNVIIPSIIMMKLNGEDALGPLYSLLVALAFPISYGIYDFFTRKKMNFFSGVGFVSVLLTGSIGLLKLDSSWVAAKETGIPLVIGLAILISQKTRLPLVRTFLNEMINLEKIDEAFEKKGMANAFEQQLARSAYLLFGVYFIVAVLNYILAVMVVTSEPGTPAFTEELGKMTALTFPIISLPMFLMLIGVLYYLFSSIQKHTDLELESIFR